MSNDDALRSEIDNLKNRLSAIESGQQAPLPGQPQPNQPNQPNQPTDPNQPPKQPGQG